MILPAEAFGERATGYYGSVSASLTLRSTRWPGASCAYIGPFSEGSLGRSTHGFQAYSCVCYCSMLRPPHTIARRKAQRASDAIKKVRRRSCSNQQWNRRQIWICTRKRLRIARYQVS